MRPHSDRGVRQVEDHMEEYGKELYAEEYLPRDAEAGDVLDFDQDQVAEQVQHGHSDPERVKHASSLGICLHVGPVPVRADVDAVALVEACAPNAGCAGDGCRGHHGRRAIEGVSALLLPLPLRYAAVVPAQNASGCVMPPRCQKFSTSMTVSWTRKNVVRTRG